MEASRLRGGLGARAITILGLGLLLAGCAGLPKPAVVRSKRLILGVRQSPLARAAALQEEEPLEVISLTAPRPESGVVRMRAAAMEPAAGPPLISWSIVDLKAEPVRKLASRRVAAALPEGEAAAPAGGDDEAAPVEREGLGWDDVYDNILDDRLLRAAESKLNGELFAIEPELEVHPEAEAEESGPAAPDADEAAAALESTVPGKGRVVKGPSGVWPTGQIGWHLGPEYTQLGEARDLVHARVAAGAPRIRVAHIDTGHAPFGQVTTPERLPANQPLNANFWEAAKKGEFIPGAEDPLTKTKEQWKKTYFFAMPGHGAATLGVLAGKAVDVDAGRWGVLKDDLGGAPDADVFCIRVSPTVVHWDSTRLAKAIDYAVDQKADVISLSHGGLPSRMLADSVNRAYENGTAIFAAAADFFELPRPLQWVRPWWFPRRTPSRTAWPAAYEPVMSVTGVTESGRSYALSPSFWKSLWPGNWGSWSLRGSYGPDSVMDHTIAAYAPNIPFARYAKANQPLDRIALDGGGTSAATPQVAAAAALWLQWHQDDPVFRQEIPGADGQPRTRWRSWEKAENVYAALRAKAKKARGTPDDEQRRYFGAGVVQALSSLTVSPSAAVTRRGPATVDVTEALATALLSMYVLPHELPERRRKLFWESVALEVAQLAALDVKVAEALDGLRDAQGLLPAASLASRSKEEVDSILEAPRAAIRSSPHASAFLKTRL